MNKKIRLASAMNALSMVLCAMACQSDASPMVDSSNEAIMSCPSENRVEGVDISINNANGAVDWKKIIDKDKHFVVSRAYLDWAGVDPSFAGNWSNAAANGLIRGAYYVFDVSTYQDEHARAFARLVGKLGPGDLPATIDIDGPEYVVSGAHKKEEAITYIQSWLNIVEHETGKQPIIYTNQNAWNALGNTTKFSSYPLWLARYTYNPSKCPAMIGGWGSWKFWQYSDKGSIPGANNNPGPTGAIDLDMYYGTYKELQEFAGCTTADETRIAACAPVRPCASKPDGNYCGGTVAGYLGNAADFVTCANGNALSSISCGGGCTIGSGGLSDVCLNPMPPSIAKCDDSMMNGNETSQDCGGGCPGCQDGLHCLVNTDCLHGYCSSNVCISAPQILVDNLSNPVDLALDAGNIYWIENCTSGGALRKVPKSGGNIVTLSSSLAGPMALLVDASHVYVLESNAGSNGMIRRIPLNGGTPELVVGGLTAPQNLLQAGSNLYWGDYLLGTGGVVRTAPKGANVSSSIVAQGNGLLNAQAMAALDTDGSYLYVRNDYDQMLRFPISGGSPSILGTVGTINGLSSIRVSGGKVYFTSCNQNLVGALPAGGGATSTLATGGNCIADLVVDSSSVYFTDKNNPGGTVRSTNLSGGATKTYYPQVGGGIDVDATHVYWIVSFFANQGKVMRAPK